LNETKVILNWVFSGFESPSELPKNLRQKKAKKLLNSQQFVERRRSAPDA
jgi:hypothetical protein